MNKIMKYLKRIGWILLLIAMIPVYAFVLITFLLLCPFMILVRFIITWDDFCDAVEWVMCEFSENFLETVFGWIFKIKPE